MLESGDSANRTVTREPRIGDFEVTPDPGHQSGQALIQALGEALPSALDKASLQAFGETLLHAFFPANVHQLLTERSGLSDLDKSIAKHANLPPQFILIISPLPRHQKERNLAFIAQFADPSGRLSSLRFRVLHQRHQMHQVTAIQIQQFPGRTLP